MRFSSRRQRLGKLGRRFRKIETSVEKCRFQRHDFEPTEAESGAVERSDDVKESDYWRRHVHFEF